MRMKTKFGLIMLAVFFVIVIGMLVYDKWRYWRNSKNPITTVEAVVIDREKICHHSRYGSRYEYVLHFRPVNGGESETFTVGEAEYDAYRLGDRGTLSHRTWEFISFRPKRHKWEGNVPVGFAEDEE